MKPNPHIALIYHYDLARALNGEPVDWQAIPVNVDAGREGGDLCRAAADFAKRRDLFAMPAPTIEANGSTGATAGVDAAGRGVDTQVQREKLSLEADREGHAKSREDRSPLDRRCDVPGCRHNALKDPKCGWYPREDDGLPANPEFDVDVDHSATNLNVSKVAAYIPMTAEVWRSMGGTVLPIDRDRLRARIAGLIDQGHEQVIRRNWPADVAPLSKPGHTDDELAQILAAVRRVETEVGAAWHPDDGPPPHVNTNPRAEVAYPVAVEVDEGPAVPLIEINALSWAYDRLDVDGRVLCEQIGKEASEAHRSISVSARPSLRRWTIARAVIAWAASGRSVDDLWFTASLLATHQQCCDADATLGGLISQFTIEQAERLYEAAGQ